MVAEKVGVGRLGPEESVVARSRPVVAPRMCPLPAGAAWSNVLPWGNAGSTLQGTLAVQVLVPKTISATMLELFPAGLTWAIMFAPSRIRVPVCGSNRLPWAAGRDWMSRWVVAVQPLEKLRVTVPKLPVPAGPLLV